MLIILNLNNIIIKLKIDNLAILNSFFILFNFFYHYFSKNPCYQRSLCNYDRRLHFFSGKCGCIPKYFTGDHVHHVNGPG